jgi:multicomponent Na+:H+ antiporter subunit E
VRAFLANLLLALVWGAMTADVSLGNLLVGFVLGLLVLFASQRIFGPSRYVGRLGLLVSFLAFYLWELAMANLRVAYDVITPAQRARPGIIAVPLDARTDAEITVLGNLITMTPGSLTLDVSEDRRVIYVHAMFIEDPDALRRRLKESFERRVLELMR